MADEQNIYEALLTMKECCENNFTINGSCDCPCWADGDCKIYTCPPKDWDIKKRTVFFQ